MKILTADEIKKTECKCFELYSTEAELMLKAGTACYNEIVKKYGEYCLLQIEFNNIFLFVI